MNSENIQANNEVVLFIFSALFIGFRYIRVALSQRILIKEEENKRVVAELQYLRSQLNPHFLFNALNSIYSLILSKSDKASEATLALSELMRFHIDLSGKQYIDLSDEISMIERYIALEKLKLENRCDIHLNIKGDGRNIKIAPLIFMPFVENAFKHGISSAFESNFVHVTILADENQIEFKVSNSIPQINTSMKSSQTKLGIDNTTKRLELHYKDNYEYFSSHLDFVYTLMIKINIKQNAA
jgi:LytS/YehU family sensor histidine kinase